MNRFKAVILMTVIAAATSIQVVAAPAAKRTNTKKAPQWTRVDELRKLISVSDLPAYRDGIVEQESSYDPTGGNEDGFAGKYSYIRKEDGKLVLADLTGPGVINRIWTPTPTKDTLEFYFDGEKSPRLRICFEDLFSGKASPFVRPLCANEAGGFYCYFPFTYKKSCKILFTGELIQFHQIQYRDLNGYDVETYSPELTAEEQDIVDEICRIWSDINPTVSNYVSSYKIEERTLTLKPGDELPFFEACTGGRIVGFDIEAGAAFEGKYRDIILTAKWDGEEAYAINAPVADFFGYGFGKPAMRNILIGSALGRNYSYLPAPYAKEAKLVLKYAERDDVRQAPVQITTKVYYTDEAINPEKEGKLYTNWRREPNCQEGKHYTFLNHKGRGHYIGTIHLAQGLVPKMTEFFEGDDSTYVDGAMRIHGTGSEDYYNGGWYALLDRWDRGTSMPLHGCIDYSLQNSRTGGYRFYLSDKITFSNEIFMGIEHGPTGNMFPSDYTSVAFYYGDSPAEDQMTPTEDLREVYQPDVHPFFPQAMQVTLGAHVKTQFISSGLRCWSENTGLVRVMLTDVPEGRYKVYMNYCQKEDGAEYSVWQRQKMIHDWDTTRGKHEWIEHYPIGEIELTSQNNSISFQFHGDHYTKELEFYIIYLELVD